MRLLITLEAAVDIRDDGVDVLSAAAAAAVAAPVIEAVVNVVGAVVVVVVVVEAVVVVVVVEFADLNADGVDRRDGGVER